MNFKNKFLIFSVSILGLTACDGITITIGKKEEKPTHEHTYSTEYSFNETFHWHAATCEHTNEFKDKNIHAFEDWKIETDSTVFQEGTKSRTCSICGYKETGIVEKKSSKGMIIDNPFTVDEFIETFSNLGNNKSTTEKYYVVGTVSYADYDTSTGFRLNFENAFNSSSAYFSVTYGNIDANYVKEDYVAEQFVGATIEVYGYVLKSNNASTNNLDSYSMTLFGSDIVPMIVDVKNAGEKPHEHTFASSWTYNSTNHWHAATCEHSEEISEYGHHSFGEWTETIAPTLTTQGLKTRRCLTCGYEEKQIIDTIAQKGTIYKPFTVEEAITFMSNYSSNQISAEQYYVKGVVATAQFNSSYNSYTIYFENHESNTESPFQLYSGVFDKNSVTETYDVDSLIGKTITIYGYFKLYVDKSGNNIYEIAYLSASSSPTGSQTSPQIVRVEGTPIHTHTYSTEWSMDAINHWHAATCEHTELKEDEQAHNFGNWIVDVEATETSSGSKHRNCLTCCYREDESIPPISTSDGSFTIYSFNDFHGAVNEYSYSQHAGLARFGTYLKNVNDGNTLIIDSGDTFQGSIESNYNQGALITDVFNYAHVDVHTLGNHDFDWGEEKIESNKARINESDGWHMTNLAGNIYNYTFDTHVEGNTQQSRLGEKYYIRTLSNGIKVGIVGVIGADQITSICSPLVEDICFKNEISNIQKLSDELRTQKGCDVVIASVHGGASSTKGKGLTDISPVSGKRYCDYVACGHSHYNESIEENGIYYTQALCYGQMMYKLTFTFENNTVSTTDVEAIDYADIIEATSTIDSNITAIINKYAASYSSIGSEVIAPSTYGTFNKGSNMANLLCKAVYEEAYREGYQVDMACCNTARYSLSGSSWTYSQLYEAFPFDNVIYIVKMKGSKNVSQSCSSYNGCYHSASLTNMDSNTWYTVAVIDYLLWHTNSYRNYDYYDHSSNCMEIIGTLQKNGEHYLYRDVCADYVRGLTGTIYASDYSNSATGFNKPTY